MERLQKVLAQAGVASRRAAEELIVQGKVTVNGKVVTELGTKVNPEKDKISVEGKGLKHQEPKTYLLLNKPAGYVTTVKDPQGRRKVTDLLKGVKQRVYPVGRLDCETEGLLLLTNDGDLAFGLTHPRHKIEKTYLAHVVGIPDAKKMRILRDGVRLEDGVTAPAQARRLTIIEGNALLELKIHEGKNRQIRRMCETIGHPVMKLQRTELGGLTLAGVPVGGFRRLTEGEVESLRKKLPKVSRPSLKSQSQFPADQDKREQGKKYQPASGKPNTNKPNTAKRTFEERTNERSGAGKQGFGKPGFGKPGFGKQGTGKQGIDKQVTVEQRNFKPQLTTEKQTTAKKSTAARGFSNTGSKPKGYRAKTQ